MIWLIFFAQSPHLFGFSVSEATNRQTDENCIMTCICCGVYKMCQLHCDANVMTESWKRQRILLVLQCLLRASVSANITVMGYASLTGGIFLHIIFFFIRFSFSSVCHLFLFLFSLALSLQFRHLPVLFFYPLLFLISVTTISCMTWARSLTCPVSLRFVKIKILQSLYRCVFSRFCLCCSVFAYCIVFIFK